MTQGIEIDLDEDVVKPVKKKSAKAEPVIAIDDLESEAQATALVEIDINQPVLTTSAPEVASDPNEIPNERDFLMQLVGQVQAAKAISQFSQTLGVSKLAHVKESKAYKALKGKTINGLELSGTWVEFCNLIGMSDEKANLDIANLKTFGEEALESMAQMGVGYRDLAQYRKLPVDQRNALIQAAESGDKNQFIDLAETLIERHATEKAELTTKVSDLENDLTQAGKRAKNMDAEIERQGLTIERLSKQQRVTGFDHLTEDIRLESMHLHAGAELNLLSLQALFDKACSDTVPAERDLCIQQVYIALNAVVSRGALMIEAMKEQHPELADRVQGQNVLTGEEAERWQLEFESLKNAHGAAEAARQIQRDQAKPRGRGRPVGSTSKAE